MASPWSSFEEARAAMERIVPYSTTGAELRASGIDPYEMPNVQLLTYSDILLRFPVGSTIASEKLDRGLRECLEAGKDCRGLAITAHDRKRDRVGNFWLDALHFRRDVAISGWTFNAVILLVGERVVYTIYGGQPLLQEAETARQPLGPMQDWGGTLPGLVK